jgi:hypothetical protein
VSTSLPRKAKLRTSQLLPQTSHRRRIGRLPVKGPAIKWPRCEFLGDGWTIDRAKERSSVKKVCDE